MAESTMSLTYNDLRREVGDLLGYTGYWEDWNATLRRKVDMAIKRGLDQFYMPEPLPNEQQSHEWSFLKPDTTITLWGTATGTISGLPVYTTVSTVTATASKFFPSMVGHSFVFDTSGTSYVIAGYTSATVITLTGDASAETSGDTFTITATGDYSLPDDFGGLCCTKITFETRTIYPPMEVTSEARIRAERQNVANIQNYRPRWAAARPRDTAGTTGQRFELVVYPIPDADYVVRYRYIKLYDMLTTSSTYPPGGAYHSDTLMASVLSMAESQLEPPPAVFRQHQRFQQRLKASVAFDRRNMHADNFGYNRDQSDSQGPRVDNRYKVVTYNGTQYP